MKKLLFVLLAAAVSHSCFAQPAKSKGFTDCNELKFWENALKSKLKTVGLKRHPQTGRLEGKRAFKGFDKTKYSVHEEANQYFVRGLIFSSENAQSAKEQYKKLYTLIKSCDAKLSLKKNEYPDTETRSYSVFSKKLPNNMLLQIELIWDAQGEADTYPENYISCTVYYGKEMKEEE